MTPTLLVLAAGIGSRYGGLKQLEKFGPYGEKIIDYSIYDAIQVGYKKVVFVIRKDIAAAFKEAVSDTYAGKIEVNFVYQELDNVPAGIEVPPNREKPWGTAHAVLVAAPAIQGPFVIINADDFYGRESLDLAYKFLIEVPKTKKEKYCIIGYKLNNTLSEHGSVSRGVCETDADDNLVGLTERTKIMRGSQGIEYESQDGNKIHLDGNTPVSMNLMGFLPSMFDYVAAHFDRFIHQFKDNPKSEAMLPDVVNEVVDKQLAQIKVLKSNATWFGVTYPEDKPMVARKINELHQQGVYPDGLWR